MKYIDRRTCALLKAAEIEGDQHRTPIVIPTFPASDTRKFKEAPVRSITLAPAEMKKYLEEQSKKWGNRLRPVKPRKK